MKLRIFPLFASLSIVCAACQSNPLAKTLPGSSVTTTQTASNIAHVQAAGSLPSPQT